MCTYKAREITKLSTCGFLHSAIKNRTPEQNGRNAGKGLVRSITILYVQEISMLRVSSGLMLKTMQLEMFLKTLC